MSAGSPFTVLHFVAAESDRGGILTVVRELASAGLGRAIVAVNPRFEQERHPTLRLWRGADLAPEAINLRTLAQAGLIAWRLRPAMARRRRVFHGHSRAGLLVGLWLWLLGCDRVVVTVHCYGRQRWFYRWAALLLGERLVWLTPAMKRYYDVASGSWQGCLPNFLSAAENSEPVGAALRRDERRRMTGSRGVKPLLQGEPQPLKLGGIGTLVPWKRWHLIAEALALLSAEEQERVEFVHIGSDDGSAESTRYVEEMATRAEELGVAAQLTWRGEEPSASALLEEIDVLVIPSDREPFGLGVLEAWRAGVPVLAADGGGPADLITEGRDGWLFTNGSAWALSEKISELLRTRADLAATPQLPASEPVVARWREIYRRVSGEVSVEVI
jgi:glycosyltransferase involved in cell wall biosynthesis